MGIHPTPISVPPWTVLGYRADGRPIHVIAGGAEDDDVLAEEADDTTEPDDAADAGDTEDAGAETADTEPDDKPKPKAPAKKSAPKPGDDDYVPSAVEWRRTQEALKKANLDARRNRERARELEEQTRADETEHDKALREAREEGEKRFREPMKKAGVKTALVEAGFTGPDRLMKLIDWDSVTVEDDGGLIGVESEVDRLKAEYPEFLQQAQPKQKPRPNGAPKPAVDVKPKSAAEQHAARILSS